MVAQAPSPNHDFSRTAAGPSSPPPDRTGSPSLPGLALALIDPSRTYEDIAARFHISVDDLVALLSSPELQQHIANLAALNELRHRLALARANEASIARLEALAAATEDPAEQRRAATAITRTRATDRGFARSALPTSAPAPTPQQRSAAYPPTIPDHRNAPTSVPPRPLPEGGDGMGSAPSELPETSNDPAPAFPHPESQIQNPQSPASISSNLQSQIPNPQSPPPRLPTPPLPREAHRSLSPQQVVLATLARFQRDNDPDALCTLYHFSTIAFRAGSTHPMTFVSKRRNLLHPLTHLRQVTACDITPGDDQAAATVAFIRKDGAPAIATFRLLHSTNRAHYHGCWLIDSVTIEPQPSAADTS